MNKIPKNPTWCSHCISRQPGYETACSHGQPEPMPCPYHIDGKEYAGPGVYEPSSWVLSVIGEKYTAWSPNDYNETAKTSTRTWKCIGYDPRNGFWMETIDELGPRRLTNISERAIDRTWHLVMPRRPT